MDDLRAMREAHFAKAPPRAPRQGAVAPPVAPPARRAPAAPPRAPRESEPAADTGPAVEALCGHRNISGRTCTREAGHAAKNHRYS